MVALDAADQAHCHTRFGDDMKLTVMLARRLVWGANGKVLPPGFVFAFCGIFLATLFVLVALGILAGYQRAYREAVLRFNAHVVVSMEPGLDENDVASVNFELAKLTGISPHVATPYVYRETLMPTREGMQPLIFKGVDFTVLREVYPFTFEDFSKNSGQTIPQAYLGRGLVAQQAEITRDHVLKYLKVNSDAKGFSTGQGRLSLSGIFESGLYHYDGQYVLLDGQELRRCFPETKLWHGVEVRLEDLSLTHSFAQKLKENLDPRFMVTTWDELNFDLLKALKLERTTVFIIVTLITVVACLNIFGFNFLFFVGRTREFRILSLLGLGEKEIGKVLRCISMALGFFATLVAVAFALGILWVLRYGPGIPLDPTVYYVDRVPAYFDFVWFAAFLGLAWLLCDLASLFAGRVMIRRYLGQKV